MRTMLHRLAVGVLFLWAFVLPAAAQGLPPTITLAGLPGSTVPGVTLTVTAGVFGAGGPATGNATFYHRNVGTNELITLCVAPLDPVGNVPCTFTTPATGSYRIEVYYSGDVIYDLASATFVFATQQATPMFSLTGAPSGTYLPGTSITMSVAFTHAGPDPTGGVEFRLYTSTGSFSAYLCTPALVAGQASCTFSAPGEGDWFLRVQYGGDFTTLPGSADYAFITRRTALTITPTGAPSGTIAPGAAINMSVVLSHAGPDPTGGVEFRLYTSTGSFSAYLCTPPLVAGQASCAFPAPGAGDWFVRVLYGGDFTTQPGFADYAFSTMPIPPLAITTIRPNTGGVAGGSSIELEGTNLNTVSVVTIGGAAAAIYRQSATSLTVTAPAHAAGPVDVYIRNSDASASVTVVSGFTYVDNDDIARDFSLANPSPRWTYGAEPSRGGTFTAYPTLSVNTGLDVWGGAPSLWHNPNTATINVATNYTPAGKLGLHPGPSGENSVARWTAPFAGTYRVEGSFTGSDNVYPTTTDVAILRNNNAAAPLFTATIASYGVPSPFGIDVAVNAGDTIEFTVGYGGNGYFGDATLLDAVITLLVAGRPPTVPDAPVMGSATAGNGQATVTFSAPASDGGSPITSYTVISSPGGIAASGSGSPIPVPGLANGTTYTFTVYATNSIGSGPASAPSNAVTPVAPTPVPMTYAFSGTASGTLAGISFSNAAITITATGDASNRVALGGGLYCVVVSRVSIAIAGAAPVTATDALAMFSNNPIGAVGLQRGCNSADWIGMYSLPTLATYALQSAIAATATSQYTSGSLNTTAGVLQITTTGITQFNSSFGAAPPPSVPGAPVIGSATINSTNSAQVDVSFSPPASNGGSPITGYTATASPGGMTSSGSGSPITLTGLSTCVVYTVRVTATNAVGTSAPSAASNSISLPIATPPGVPTPFFTPSSVAFASRTVSTTSPAQTLTITNGGACPITIASMAITGDFTFVSACPATLAPGATCTVDVTFTPLVVGARAGSLTVNTTDVTGTAGRQVLPLSGTGAAGAVPVASVSPPAIDFAAQAVDTDSALQLVTVRNTGTATLTFGPIAVNGDFRQVALPAGNPAAACPVDLVPDASCQIAVVFHPTTVNLRTGTLSIQTNAGTLPTNVSLVGTGLTPLAPQLSVPVALAFEPQRVGTKSPGKPVALANTSPVVAAITELSASGDFSVSDTCTSIVAGTTCSPLVFFQPTQIGPRTGTLTVRTLRDLDPYLIGLTGAGEENLRPVLELSLTRVGFGNAFIGSATPVRIDLRNVGQAPLAIESILATGSFMVTHGCATVAPGTSCTIEVAFVPASPGGQAAVVEIRSNAEGSPHRIDVSGTGCFVPSPSRARFGLLLCGS